MSGFTLVPVEGGEPIQLPSGETVIGRGPLLRVGDKRVSRHHGLLENMNGCLRLKPIHMNPCFIQSSLTDDPQPLQRDSWFSLQDGDLFSLLPGQLIYRVVAVGDGCSSRNTQRVEEELPVSPKSNVETLPALTPPPQEPTEAPPPTQDQVSPLQTGNKEVEMPTEVTPRRRVLPSWMMTAVTAPPGSPSSSPKDQRAATASKRRTAAKKPKTTSAEEEQEERGEDEKPKKRRNVHTDAQRRDVPAVPESTADISDESDGFSVEADEEERRGPNTNMAAGGPAVARPEDKKTKTESNNSSSSSPSCTARTSCPYGKQCYRKNPVHFQEFSHPGDADYKEEEPEDVERPECPYGSDCYRKNPLHRKEYKHSEKPAYNTRPRRKEAAKEDGDEDFDDDDSFINDDSEDGGDDSDYAPPDSDDSGKEDIRRLQKEAQAFLKKRK